MPARASSDRQLDLSSRPRPAVAPEGFGYWPEAITPQPALRYSVTFRTLA